MIVKTINDERFKTKIDSAITSKTQLEDVFNFNARYLVSLILNPHFFCSKQNSQLHEGIMGGGGGSIGPLPSTFDTIHLID